MVAIKLSTWKKKKSTTWELQVTFYLGPNEDCSPRSKLQMALKLLHGRWGKVHIYTILLKGEFRQSSMYFLQEVSASYKEQLYQWRICAFLDLRTYKNCTPKTGSWKYLCEDLSCQLFPEHSCLNCAPNLNYFQRGVEVNSCSNIWFNSYRGRQQVPMAYQKLDGVLVWKWHFVTAFLSFERSVPK